jgi:hypothetical protein
MLAHILVFGHVPKKFNFVRCALLKISVLGHVQTYEDEFAKH